MSFCGNESYLANVLRLLFLERLYLWEVTRANVDTQGYSCGPVLGNNSRGLALCILCSAMRETQVDFLADYMQGCLSGLLTEQSRQFCIQMYLTQ
jgi:hypothetical protein